MNNSEILGELGAVRQIVENDFSATNGHFEDDSITKLRTHAFNKRTNLRSASFPNMTSDLPGGVFYNCNKLKKIILSAFNGKTVQEGFYNCGILGLADLGNCSNLNGIQVFANCSSLTAIILRRNSVCVHGGSAFGNSRYDVNGAGGAYVYVPRNLISSYQTATNWSTFYAAHPDMFRALEDYTVDGTVTGDIDLTLIDVMPTPIYTLSNQTFNADTFIDTGIELFDTTEPEFTIMVDMTIGNMAGSMSEYFFHCWDNDNSYGFKFSRNMAGGDILVQYRRPGTSSNASSVLTGGYNNRIQAAIIIKKNLIQCFYYRNGIYNTLFENHSTNPSSTLSTTLGIGGYNNTTGRFKGIIHDFKLYDKALNERQIESIFGAI